MTKIIYFIISQWFPFKILENVNIFESINHNNQKAMVIFRLKIFICLSINKYTRHIWKKHLSGFFWLLTSLVDYLSNVYNIIYWQLNKWKWCRNQIVSLILRLSQIEVKLYKLDIVMNPLKTTITSIKWRFMMQLIGTNEENHENNCADQLIIIFFGFISMYQLSKTSRRNCL